MFFFRFLALAVATNVALVSAEGKPSDTCNVNASIWSLTGFKGRRKEIPVDSECNPLADPFVASVGSAKLPRGTLCQLYTDPNCETRSSIVSSRSTADTFKNKGRQIKSIKCLYIPDDQSENSEKAEGENDN
ncbi:uncharacterized protein GIQ15_05282 [Arthroderma uncinatum]|uniref:uncharacterized protein n=1 Tax=Arthroderma uncinatum TaxID=74035 RepID=UPI00144A95BD|nr:uncharacterized protein GIQ15_05282 [Arthroderma uncinatum]KAF3482523.1 hypothetical protein GIQ15_05282 [Arthroderma uncinatum]